MVGEVFHKTQIASCASEKIKCNKNRMRNVLIFYEVGRNTGV